MNTYQEASVKGSGNLSLATLVLMGMTTFAFRLFLLCLIVCATLALGAVWLQDRITYPVYFQSMASFFIVGLASFLFWFSRTLLAIRTLLHDRTISA